MTDILLSFSPGCAALAAWHPRRDTCTWPRNSAWTPTGPQSRQPPRKPNPTLKFRTAASSCTAEIKYQKNPQTTRAFCPSSAPCLPALQLPRSQVSPACLSVLWKVSKADVAKVGCACLLMTFEPPQHQDGLGKTLGTG